MRSNSRSIWLNLLCFCRKKNFQEEHFKFSNGVFSFSEKTHNEQTSCDAEQNRWWFLENLWGSTTVSQPTTSGLKSLYRGKFWHSFCNRKHFLSSKGKKNSFSNKIKYFLINGIVSFKNYLFSDVTEPKKYFSYQNDFFNQPKISFRNVFSQINHRSK